MTMVLGPGEPPAGPWQVVAWRTLIDQVSPHAPLDVTRPWVVAVDGRSGSGKSTLANRIAQTESGTTVVHTDDIAWHYSFFDWSHLLVDGVLRPARNGESVRYRPPGWEAQGRSDAVTVPAGQRLIVVEGIGASRTELLPWIDAAIWVQSDFHEAERRGLERDGGADAARAFWAEWMSEEIPFLRHDQPWKRASLIVAGSHVLDHDFLTQVVIAPPLGTTVG